MSGFDPCIDMAKAAKEASRKMARQTSLKKCHAAQTDHRFVKMRQIIHRKTPEMCGGAKIRSFRGHDRRLTIRMPRLNP